MKFLEQYYLHRAISRIRLETTIYGSCHTQMSMRGKWNLMRFILGPIKYKFLHPFDEICQCDWKSGDLRSLCRRKS